MIGKALRSTHLLVPQTQFIERLDQEDLHVGFLTHLASVVCAVGGVVVHDGSGAAEWGSWRGWRRWHYWSH